jgi:WD40 repeat protein
VIGLFSCKGQKTVDIDAENRRQAFVQGGQFSPDGKTLALAVGWPWQEGGGEVRLIDCSSWKVISCLKSKKPLYRLAFSPDGKTLAAGVEDATVLVWDVTTGSERAVLKGHSDVVYTVAFAPDGKTLASGSWDKSIKLWDTGTWQEKRTLQGHTSAVYAVFFSSAGGALASGSSDGSARLWDTHTGKQLVSPKSAEEGPVYTVTVCPNGNILVWHQGEIIKLWDIRKQRELAKLDGHKDWVRCLAVSPDGRMLASASRDGTVRLWDLQKATELATFREASEAKEQGRRPWLKSVTFSVDGKTVVSGGTYYFNDGRHVDRVKVWDVATGKELKSYTIGPPLSRTKENKENKGNKGDMPN